MTLILQVGFVMSVGIRAYADTGPPIPADLEFCAAGSGHELHFDTKIKGVTDWMQTGPISCVYQTSDIWHVLDCDTGHMLDIGTFRSKPTEWSADPPIATDVSEAAMIYRETLVKSRTSVSFDVIRDDMRDLGAEVSERNTPNYVNICESS